MMADILESDTDDGKDIKDGVAPEGNMVPPGGETIGDDADDYSEGSLHETFEYYEDVVMGWMGNPWFYAILIPLVIWSMVWKGLALWRAARNNQLYWFVGLLLINTAGLVEIGYLKWGQKKSH